MSASFPGENERLVPIDSLTIGVEALRPKNSEKKPKRFFQSKYFFAGLFTGLIIGFIAGIVPYATYSCADEVQSVTSIPPTPSPSTLNVSAPTQSTQNVSAVSIESVTPESAPPSISFSSDCKALTSVACTRVKDCVWIPLNMSCVVKPTSTPTIVETQRPSSFSYLVCGRFANTTCIRIPYCFWNADQLSCMERTSEPTTSPLVTSTPTVFPTTKSPSVYPSRSPTPKPSTKPTRSPSLYPSTNPTQRPTAAPSTIIYERCTQYDEEFCNRLVDCAWITERLQCEARTESPTKTPTLPTFSPTFQPTTQIPSPTSVEYVQCGQYPTDTCVRFKDCVVIENRCVFRTDTPTLSPTTSEPTVYSNVSIVPTSFPTTSTHALCGQYGRDFCVRLRECLWKDNEAECVVVTSTPTSSPTSSPSLAPTVTATNSPTQSPLPTPTTYPTKYPTVYPTKYPTGYPTSYPTDGNVPPGGSTPTTSPPPAANKGHGKTLEAARADGDITVSDSDILNMIRATSVSTNSRWCIIVNIPSYFINIPNAQNQAVVEWTNGWIHPGGYAYMNPVWRGRERVVDYEEWINFGPHGFSLLSSFGVSYTIII
jgi:hypothetical protein